MSPFGELENSEFEDLRNVFFSQAYEIVENLQDLLLALETSPDDGAAVKAIKRHVHTLKGDSNSIGLTVVGGLCHTMEDVLSSLISGPGDLKHDCIDLLISGTDTISRLLSETESGKTETAADTVMARMDAFLNECHGRPAKDIAVVGEKGTDLTEYQYLDMEDARRNGLFIFDMEMVFHPMCREKGPAVFMLIRRLDGKARVIRSLPDPESPDIEKADRVRILMGSHLEAEQLKEEAFIEGIAAEMNIRDFPSGRSPRLSPQENNRHDSPEQPDSPPCELRQPYARNEMLRIETSKVDNIIELAGELIIGRSMIDHLARDLEEGASKDDIAGRLFAANSYMERTVADLQKGIMKMRMVPVNHVFRRFPKVVRDLCAEKGKMARLDIHGRETELDKGIVDAIGEPLSHIIRNMIDHGIEEPDYRRSVGKNEEGTITLNAYHEAGRIIIEVADDGRGIGTKRLVEKAVEKGLIAGGDAEKLSDHESLNLIFLSGLSTSETVSGTSGRGVGMDAVKSAVDALKGSIEVESAPGEGTTFRFSLPLTLAVIKALLFEVGRGLYAIPVSAVTDVTRITTDDLVTVDGRDTFLLRDRIISVIPLQELLKTDGGGGRGKFILTISIGKRQVGILVDSLRGQQELVIKAVDDRYMNSRLVTGASVLGDGSVVLILDAPAIFGKAVEDEKKRTVSAWER